MKKAMRVVLGYILMVVLILQLVPCASAHLYSQENILAKSYNEKKKKYYIGGEAVGWFIDEDYHTNGTTLTYSFSTDDPYLLDRYKTYTRDGASMWSGTVNIVCKTDGTGTGLISTMPLTDDNTDIVAQCCNYKADSSGHFKSWEIKLNRAHLQSANTLAHEFGHAIGLKDMYADRNRDKLMYGYESRTATGPTTSDKWGAKVITGVHSSHTWGYKYYGISSTGGNKHIKYCTVCNGWASSMTISDCVYNSNNICSLCGIPYGVQPWSLENGTE